MKNETPIFRAAFPVTFAPNLIGARDYAMGHNAERARLGGIAAAICEEAKKRADKRFFERYHYYPYTWPMGSVEDRKVWIKDYHHAKKLLLKAAAL